MREKESARRQAFHCTGPKRRTVRFENETKVRQ